MRKGYVQKSLSSCVVPVLLVPKKVPLDPNGSDDKALTINADLDPK